MIYYDPLFTANQAHWADIGFPYIAKSAATNYVLLSSKIDCVVDYEVDEVKVIPVASAGGTFDPIVEAEKANEKKKAADLAEQRRAEAQSLRDGGKPSLEYVDSHDNRSASKNETKPGGSVARQKDDIDDNEIDLIGNDLSSDPVVI